MNWLVVSSHAGFLECLRKSGVGMACACQIFRTGSILDSNNCLSDHLAGSWTHDMGSQDFVSLFLSQDLDQSISVADSFGSGIGEEGETSLGVLDFYIKIFVLFSLSSSSV